MADKPNILQRSYNFIYTRIILHILNTLPSHETLLGHRYTIKNAPISASIQHKFVKYFFLMSVRMNPNDINILCSLSEFLLESGCPHEADKYARHAVRLAPMNPATHYVMAMIFNCGHHNFVSSEFHFRRSIELMGYDDPIITVHLAWSVAQQGRIEEAREIYRTSNEKGPDIMVGLLGWALIEERDNKLTVAAQLLDRAVEANKTDMFVTTKMILSNIEERKKNYDKALSSLDILLTHSRDYPLPPRIKGEVRLKKGRLLDKKGKFDEAFSEFVAGNEEIRTGGHIEYPERDVDTLFSSLKSIFDEPFASSMPKASVRRDCPQPIFIMGFGRSGTTLAEQMLSGHPQIYAGDELPFIHDIIQSMPKMLASPLPYPNCLTELCLGDKRVLINVLRDCYLNNALQRFIFLKNTSYFTDKMILNETHLGLINLLFPHSPLIHLIRHPLDVVLSTFSFHTGSVFRYEANLETIAIHYVKLIDLVRHYRYKMQMRIMTLRYEDMVDSQEKAVRGMLDFINLEFNSKCIDFESNKRVARTPSYSQVSQGLYKTSIYRYKNYRRHLEKIIPILEPTILSLGYTID